MIFIFIILGIAFLLCVWGCIYYAWKVYMAGHSERGMAVLNKVIKESRTYRPAGWSCKAYVHITFHGKQIEKKLSFWMHERPMTLAQNNHQIPVLIHTNKNQEVRITVEESKVLLTVLAVVCGGMALIFGLVIGLVIFYNFI